jgi:SOS-response transcriptional repressor LexA
LLVRKSKSLTTKLSTMSASRRLKVFLCHSKDDKPKVRKLYRRLIDDGFEVWLDEAKLMPGQEWDLEIRKAVRGSDVVLVCLSNSSTTKEGYVQKEIRFALDIAGEKPEGTIFLIPVRLENCSVPNRISRFQWVDLFQRIGYSKLQEALLLRVKDLNIRFDSNEVLPETAEESVRIPIIGSIAANLPFPELRPEVSYMTASQVNTVEIVLALIPTKARGDALFALEVKGESMVDAMINDGDIVVLKPASAARNGEMVAVWFPSDNTATLKYFFEEKDHYRLQPANPTMKPIFVKKSEPLEVKGKVVMVIRRVDKV